MPVRQLLEPPQARGCWNSGVPEPAAGYRLSLGKVVKLSSETASFGTLSESPQSRREMSIAGKVYPGRIAADGGCGGGRVHRPCVEARTRSDKPAQPRRVSTGKDSAGRPS